MKNYEKRERVKRSFNEMSVLEKLRFVAGHVKALLCGIDAYYAELGGNTYTTYKGNAADDIGVAREVEEVFENKKD